ncbi:hypothetical protein AUP78_12705 [Escherichia coli]|uniref:hypothetical protein n=1 Tax=Escherichia coli TaxID=562 RepID=UPI000775166F|nr:hypothetical protein [Escherichia coli]KXP84283.1 hypothetical protein AUP78_12705 [Escherichia coli]
MAIKLVKVKHLKGGETIRAWYGYEFTVSAFYFGPGGQVTLFDEDLCEVGQWHLEQYVEVLNENQVL